MSGLKQTFLTPLSEVSLVQKEVLGTLRYENNQVHKYINIQNSATVAGVAGDMVVYFAATGYAANRVCVRAADGDATVPFAAGILNAACAGVAATNYYGWIQVKGPATLSTAVTGAAAGKVFKASTTDKTFAVATAATDNIAGVSMNTTTGVSLDCMV